MLAAAETGGLHADLRAVLGEAAEERRIRAATSGELAEAAARSRKILSNVVAVGLVVMAALALYLALPKENLVTSTDSLGCHLAQRDIMRAIVLYSRSHGGPPASLDLLAPDYLDGRLIAPVNGKPFRYKTDGDVIALNCPES